MNYLIVWLLLTLSNFVYQALKDDNLGTALERSYFQGIAILAVFIANTIWV